jgi:phosphohistidine phosphatase
MADSSPARQLVVLVHHGEALPEHLDPQRPLSAHGRELVERVAKDAAKRGIHPAAVWHSGKLRARQTAEAYWRACNALAEFRAIGGLRPEDGPWQLRDHLLGESRTVMMVGHMPHLPRALGFLTTGDDNARAEFPLNGLVLLERDGDARVWTVRGRLSGDAIATPVAWRVDRRAEE